jgi:hypothetical protein
MSVRTSPGVPPAARELIGAASRVLADASQTDQPREQYALAHLAALRAAAAVLACHARPTRRRGPRSAWELLSLVAPELSEWAAFFAAGAAKRAAAEAGLGQVSQREAADLIREVECFLDLICARLQVAQQPGLAALSYAG